MYFFQQLISESFYAIVWRKASCSSSFFPDEAEPLKTASCFACLYKQNIKRSLQFELMHRFELLNRLLQNLSLWLNADLPIQNAHLLITASRCTAPERSCVGQQLFQAAWEHRNLKHGPIGGLSHCLLYLCRCRRFQWRCIQACKCLAQVIFGLFVKLFEPLMPHQNASSKFRN